MDRLIQDTEKLNNRATQLQVDRKDQDSDQQKHKIGCLEYRLSKAEQLRIALICRQVTEEFPKLLGQFVGTFMPIPSVPHTEQELRK